MNALLIALQFLTRLPVRLAGMPEPQAFGRSLLWYPAVGALLGALLTGFLQLPLPPLLHAALLLALWVALTGALHLDGLADCADAWVGGHGDRERTLAIMKDPSAGPMGVTALVIVLLLKFSALVTLLDAGHVHALWLVPLLARAAMPALFLTTPYLRSGGLGSALAEHLPRRSALLVVLLALALCITAKLDGVWLALVAVLGFALIRAALLRRLGGFTGDGAGAMLELLETALLLTLAVAANAVSIDPAAPLR